MIQVLRNTSHVLKLQQNTPFCCRKKEERGGKERERRGEGGRRGGREGERGGGGRKHRESYSEIDTCTCELTSCSSLLFSQFRLVPIANTASEIVANKGSV